MMSVVCSPLFQARCSQQPVRSEQRNSWRPFTSAMPRVLAAPIAPLQHSRLSHLSPAALGGADGPEEENKLTRETEPDEFWQTPSEAKGENPAKDPLAIIGILGIFFPFILLGIAIATGYVDISNYRYGGH